MKIGIFTDSHYSSQEITCGCRYNRRSLEKIKQAYAFFEQEHCDLVICLGDLIDREASHAKEIENLKAVAAVIADSPMKTVCLMGNHDAFAFTKDDFYTLLNLPQPSAILRENKKLLFLDACYFQNGHHYLPDDSDWTDTFYPDTENLRQQIESAEEDIYLFVHQNLDLSVREDHRVKNAAEVHRILAASPKVKAVYQGHYHPGFMRTHDHILYRTFPAMCENENAFFTITI